MAVVRYWITVNETSEALGLHPMSIRKMIARGIIPAVRIGRSIRIDKRRLDEVLEGDLRAAPTAAQGRS
jgi:excisionase family DNA binding protein